MAFVSGSSTAFGVFDSDPQFQRDADRVVKYVATKLGGGLPGAGEDFPHVQVEITEKDTYVSFEDAVLEYGSIVNQYQAKSAIASWLGQPTGSLTAGTSRYNQSTLEWARRQAQPFGEEAGVGGVRPVHSGSLSVMNGVQDYDLQALLAPTGSDGQPRRIIVRKIHYYSPLSAFRFFGTTSTINYLNSQFNFESFTPETIFYLLPIWEDVLRGQQFKESNNVRRSHYSYELRNNVLRLYPVPGQALNLHLEYEIIDEADPLGGDSTYGVSNISNLPFYFPSYSNLNSVARQWIWRMALAFCKEMLGMIRRKLGAIPIPNGDLNLDGEALISDARGEMEVLRNELRGMLDETTYDRIAATEAEKAANLQRVLQYAPLKVYIGTWVLPWLLPLALLASRGGLS